MEIQHLVGTAMLFVVFFVLPFYLVVRLEGLKRALIFFSCFYGVFVWIVVSVNMFND